MFFEAAPAKINLALHVVARRPDRYHELETLVVFADRSDLDFGEIWQGRGLSFDLASAGFCGGG